MAFTKPPGYDASQYELLLRVFNTGWRETFSKFDPVPNYKTDANNHGPFSFDNIGMNYDYPEADYARRAAIIKEHEIYQKGLLYFWLTIRAYRGMYGMKWAGGVWRKMNLQITATGPISFTSGKHAGWWAPK
ncbi:FAD-dependent oxidoreductase [Chitinophaga sedimenti]|uniref:FAD-dependent oxidoreductase n=1 Tax=Chitinophaga sedimenti TaxID=2033606 RepID=UPI002003AD2D|nr:FAD-dependent oxidoreductase [Chitinophaga sedimenti]MCK7554446.1 FAD-dependent oxidoreductase [Chitinophaga sedimenti]